MNKPTDNQQRSHSAPTPDVSVTPLKPDAPVKTPASEPTPIVAPAPAPATSPKRVDGASPGESRTR